MNINWDEYYFPNEMMEQADAIESCMAALKDTLKEIAGRAGHVKEVHIVGSGDCYFIGFAAAHAFQKYAGIRAAGYEAYDYYLLKPEVDKDTLVVLFSSSGKSLYVLKSLEYVRSKNGIAIGVTNHADSTLGTDCSIPLVTVATGVSKSFPTKTSTSGLALMFALAAELGRANKALKEKETDGFLEEIAKKTPAVIREIYREDYPKLKDNIQKFLEARCYAFVGSGPSRSAGMIGAAKIIETNRCHIMTTNAEEYMHMNGFAIKSADAVIVIGNSLSDHREIQVVEYAKAQCARVLVIGNVACEETENVIKAGNSITQLSEFPAVLASMVVTHLFACELSRRSFKDPDAPHDVDLRHVIDLLYTGPVAGWQV